MHDIVTAYRAVYNIIIYMYEFLRHLIQVVKANPDVPGMYSTTLHSLSEAYV